MQKNLLDYPVEFADDAFGESTIVADTIRQVTGVEAPRTLIIADYNVFERVEDIRARINEYFKKHNLALVGTPCVIGSGEKIKLDQPHCMMKLAELFTRQSMSSHDVVLALGGGAILDLAGFVTAIHQSNAKLIRMPSTPAAMFGASYANSAAVNVRNRKDMLKAVSNPSAVIIDSSLAQTVLDGVWRAGFAEAMRLAVVSSEPLTKGLAMLAPAFHARNQTTLARLVKAVYKVRAQTEETGFCGWLANRMEELSNFKLPHGYAVSMAIAIETRYAVLKENLTEADRELVINAMMASGALEGAVNSRFLLSRGKDIFKAQPELSTTIAGLGAAKVEAPDQALYIKALNMIK